MQTRRLIAAGVVVVIVIALALLVKSCDSSATTSALKNYNAAVYQLIQGSTSNAQSVLGPKGLESGNLTGVGTALATAEQNAISDVRKAQTLSVPSQMAAAQASLLTVLDLRQRGLKLIANYAQQAASKSSSKDAVYQISLGTAQLFTSDVIYKTTVTEDLAKALNANGIPIGTGAGEQRINGAQVVSDLGWLDQTWIADKIGAQQSTAAANANNDQPGLHGHAIGTVTVGGIPLQAGVTNQVKASNARHWTIAVGNGGDYNEYQVECSIQIVSQSDAGTGVIPETIAHQTTNCDVTLQSVPTTGPYQVIARIAKVPGETTLSNNTATYDVTFTP